MVMVSLLTFSACARDADGCLCVEYIPERPGAPLVARPPDFVPVYRAQLGLLGWNCIFVQNVAMWGCVVRSGETDRIDGRCSLAIPGLGRELQRSAQTAARLARLALIADVCAPKLQCSPLATILACRHVDGLCPQPLYERGR